MNKNLSKTRFTTALSCETKAYYHANKETYAKEIEIINKFRFFQGNQVGELVKFWYKKKEPLAIEIESVREDQQIEETLSLLKKDRVTIFEATLKYNNLIIRVDVLQKIGNIIRVIEAKSNVYNENKEIPKLPDIAFQSYVISLIFPNYEIEPYLLFLDKDHTIKFDGLSQLIGDFKKNGSDKVKIKDEIKLKELENFPFKIINVKDEVKNIQDKLFISKIKKLSELLAQGLKPTPKLTNLCKKCEFYQSPNVTSNLKSGWHECMSNFFKESSNIEREDSIFAIYYKEINDKLLSHRVLAMKSLPSINTNSIQTTQGIINRNLRQNLQLLESKNEIKKIFLEVSIVKELYNKWKYPLHFIDFETTAPPLPYFRNRRPGEKVLFQFSHHMIHENGKIEHKTEKIIAKPNINPNFIILDELIKALNNDEGTIFHWHHHERTTLNQMLQEAKKENVKNFDDVNLFCESLGMHKESEGRLFDFCKFFNDYIYVPGASAKSSMKQLLPALLKNSTFLKEKYQMPIYGTDIMPGHNFKNKVWYIEKNNLAKSPYELLDEDENISDGGQAMIAFDQLQQKDLDNQEREKLEKQLKKYCELDTLGMVMAYEAIKSNL